MIKDIFQHVTKFCLFNGVWVGIPQTGSNRLSTAFYGPSCSKSGICLVMVLSLLHYLNLGCLCQRSGSFVQNLSFLLKGPIRACRRVRVYSPHWWLGSVLFLFFYCCWLGVVVSSIFLLFNVTAAIFQLYKKFYSYLLIYWFIVI